MMNSLKCLFLIMSLCLLTNCAFSQNQESSIESKALSFVVDDLIGKEKLLEQNDGLLKEYSVGIELLKKDISLYSFNQTCLLSRLDEIEDEEKSIPELSKVRGFNFDRNEKEEKGERYVKFKLPSRVSRMSLEEYKGSGLNGSFFLTVRHHLEFERMYMVEVNIAAFSEMPNISQYSFYVYLDSTLKVVDWNLLESYDPIPSDGCNVK